MQHSRSARCPMPAATVSDKRILSYLTLASLVQCSPKLAAMVSSLAQRTAIAHLLLSVSADFLHHMPAHHEHS